MISYVFKWIRSLPRALPWRPSGYDSAISRGMVLAILVGVIAGFGAVLFRNGISFFHFLSFDYGKGVLSALGRYYVVVIPALGGLVVGPLIYFFAREAKGHGVPEVMIAVAQQGGRIRGRVAFVKILASAVCIGTGGSVGREGPIVQIGATFGSTIAQRLGLPREWVRTLVACGAAGGISATFNAPIAGVFFALEIILVNFSTRYFSVVVVSSVVADVVAHAFFPDVANLTVPAYSLRSGFEIPLYAVLGLAAALVGVAFIVILYLAEDLFDLIRIPDYLKPVAGGLGIGALGFYSPDLFGVGYPALEKAANGEILTGAALVLMGLKILATSATIGSGGSGGVFAPALFICSMLGLSFGHLANVLFPNVTAPAGAYALVGMAAVFAGAARAPITAVVILFELTRDYSIILPLMLAVAVSTVVAQALHKDSIYTEKMRRKGIKPPTDSTQHALDSVLVRQVMSEGLESVSPDVPVRELGARFRASGQRGLPVVGPSGELEGLVTVSDLEAALREGKTEASAGEIATRSLVTAFPDQTVHQVLLRMGAERVGRIPVVSRENQRRLLGILRRHDIIRAYIESNKPDKGKLR